MRLWKEITNASKINKMYARCQSRPESAETDLNGRLQVLTPCLRQTSFWALLQQK